MNDWLVHGNAPQSWFPSICEQCGAKYDEDDGPDWNRDGDRIEPYGWCSKCGWRCEPCPDIEDAYERSPQPCPTCKGFGEIGAFDFAEGAYRNEPCPGCKGDRE